MEKETRMSKYKELRDELKDDVTKNPSTSVQRDADEDDFLSFLHHNDENIDNTMVTPMEVNTSSKEEVDSVMNRGVDHNTRLDIFNKIRQDSRVVEEENSNEQPGSLLDKLAEMSPSEDVEALHEYQREVEYKEKKHRSSSFMNDNDDHKESKFFFKKKDNKVKSVVVEEDDDENDVVSKIINYVTIALAVVAVVLFALVIKSVVFG